MSAHGAIDYSDASPEVRAVFDDIKRTREIKDVNNFWKCLARDPATLKRTWESIKEIMAPGALDARAKEMIYLAVSVTNGCGYCIASHNAAARKAGPNIRVDSEPKVPASQGHLSVSPSTMSIEARSAPNSSAAICANEVITPWPISILLENTATRPLPPIAR